MKQPSNAGARRPRTVNCPVGCRMLLYDNNRFPPGFSKTRLQLAARRSHLHRFVSAFGAYPRLHGQSDNHYLSGASAYSLKSRTT